MIDEAMLEKMRVRFMLDERGMSKAPRVLSTTGQTYFVRPMTF